MMLSEIRTGRNQEWEREWRRIDRAIASERQLLLPLRRIWHPYTIWEDYLAGMWRDVTKQEAEALLPRAIEFTGGAALYGSFMQKVIRKWPITCEHNLSDKGQNRRAFIGHAAACLAINSPEYITREAWGHLTQDQQDAANAEADRAIKDWRIIHEAKNKALHRQVGAAGIPARNTGRSAAKIGGSGKSSQLSCHLHGHSEKRHSLTQPRRKQARVPIV